MLRAGKAPADQPARPADRLDLDQVKSLLPYLLVLVMWIVLSAQSIARIDSYEAGELDLDANANVIWNTANGAPFASMVMRTNDNYLAEQLPFTVPVLALGYAILPDLRLLVVVQSAALVASSLAIFFYAMRELASRGAALLLQASYLATPLLGRIALDDFQFVTLSALPLAFAAYLLLASRRLMPGLAIAALTMLFDAHAALPLLGLGALLVWRGRPRLGLGLAAVCAAYLLTATMLVMPAFQLAATHDDMRVYGGNGAGDVRAVSHFHELLEDPIGTLTNRLQPEPMATAFQWLLVPSGGLALASPASLLPAAAVFVTLILEDEEMSTRYQKHWGATLLPFLGLAAVSGVRRLRHTRLTRTVALGLVVLGTAFGYWEQSPLPGGEFDGGAFRPDARVGQLTEALALVPEGVPLLASGSLVAYLNHRREIYVFPPDWRYPEPLRDRVARARVQVLDLAEGDTEEETGDRPAGWIRQQAGWTLFAPVPDVLILMRDRPTPEVQLTDPPRFRDASGDVVSLTGYDTVTRSGRLEITLHWRADSIGTERLERVVELIGPDNAVVGSARAMPLLEFYPTDRWTRGQTVLDRVVLCESACSGIGSVAHQLRVAWHGHIDGAQSGSALTVGRSAAYYQTGPLRLAASR